LFELETEIEDMRLEEKNIHLETLQSRTVVDEQLPANDLTHQLQTNRISYAAGNRRNRRYSQYFSWTY